MLRLSDWNKVTDHAVLTANKLSKETGCDVRAKEYEMYDGRKGIYLQVFDRNGKFYMQTASGIHDTAIEYVKAINSEARRLVKEVL